MKKALFITLNQLDKIHTGGSVCSVRNIRLLSGNFNTRTYVVQSSKIEKIISSFSLLFPPFSIQSFRDIKREIKLFKPDLIFVDTSLLGVLIRFISRKTTIKTISFFHNVEYDYLNVRFGKSPVKYLYKLLCRINEKLTLKFSDTSVCLNKRDQNRLYELYNYKVSSIIPITLEPNISSEMVYKKHISNNSNLMNLLFVGSLNRSNYLSVKWFIEKVMPSLKNVTLQIVGKDFETTREEFESKNVKVIGTVEDLSDYYFDSMCVVSPIFEGAGMKVKIAEALMYGCIVLGTDEALEGYELDNSIYNCNTVNEFCDAVSEVYHSVDRIKLNTSSRKLFDKKYSDISATKIFNKIIIDL